MDNHAFRFFAVALFASAVLAVVSEPAPAQAAPVEVFPAPAWTGAAPGSMMALILPEDRAAMLADALATGDDNGDGTVDESESGWNCFIHGNQICGPGALGSV